MSMSHDEAKDVLAEKRILIDTRGYLYVCSDLNFVNWMYDNNLMIVQSRVLPSYTTSFTTMGSSLSYTSITHDMLTPESSEIAFTFETLKSTTFNDVDGFSWFSSSKYPTFVANGIDPWSKSSSWRGNGKWQNNGLANYSPPFSVPTISTEIIDPWLNKIIQLNNIPYRIELKTYQSPLMDYGTLGEVPVSWMYLRII